jgi:hypothetical protein
LYRIYTVFLIMTAIYLYFYYCWDDIARNIISIRHIIHIRHLRQRESPPILRLHHNFIKIDINK